MSSSASKAVKDIRLNVQMADTGQRKVMITVVGAYLGTINRLCHYIRCRLAIHEDISLWADDYEYDGNYLVSNIKDNAVIFVKPVTASAVTSAAVTATTASISKGLSAAAASTASTSTPMAIRLKPNATLPSNFTATSTTSTATTCSLDTTDTSTGALSLDNGLIDTLVADDTENDITFVYENEDNEDVSREVLDLMDDYGNNEELDADGADEDYLDMTDTDFIPKRTLRSGARKTFPNNGSGVMLSPPKRQPKTDNRCFKLRYDWKCGWLDCNYISNYKCNVTRHYRVHTGERPFKCQFKGCPFSAAQAGNMKAHQQRHGHHTPNAQKFGIKSTHNTCQRVT